jgi:hypothetical protein
MIPWFSNQTVEAGITRAREEQKPILVDFWSPTCLGCAKLFAMTYSTEPVRRLLSQEFVCIKYNTTQPNEWFKRLNGRAAHFWHPHLVVMDDRLTEGKRLVGYLPPASLIAHVRIGAGMLHMYHRRFREALRQFELALQSGLVPEGVTAEALYWVGVAAYRVHGTLDRLTPHWNALVTTHADTDWANRSDCLDVEIPEQGFDPHDPGSVRILQRSPAAAGRR